jgi:polyisoprenoid-binding protein YceI
MTTSTQLHIFTYKDGLLARLAHDLRLSLTEFSVSLHEGEVQASFQLSSLRVDGQMLRGQLRADVPSAKDKRAIQQTVSKDILKLERFPDARFEGRVVGEANPGAGPKLSGELTLLGHSQPITLELKLGPPLVIEATLVPTRWGISPYRALAGAIRLQDRILIRLELDRDTEGLGFPDWQSANATWSAK